MEKMFKIHKHYEKEGLYYIETDYGVLHTDKKTAYDKAVREGFIIIKIED